MDSFIKDRNRWRLDITEQKTKKVRAFTVPLDVYSLVQEYAYAGGIDKDAKLFSIGERQIERHLNKVFTKMTLSLRSYESHSYRKFFATKVYTDKNYDIKLVQTLLQHSSQAPQRFT